ncbi:MAG: hypothetical protein HY277_07095, partial [Ignavibacteriales bacterium]|nr:hypothetical protein [Ignavibacteriales bacterium]
MTELYVDLAIPVAVNRIFTYSVPHELYHAARRGVRVVAPFGKRTVIGFIVETSLTSQTCAERGKTIPHIKAIHDILDPEPVLSADLLNLTQWMAEYYFAPWGEVLKAVLVQGAARPAKRIVSATTTEHEITIGVRATGPKQAALLKELRQHGAMTIAQLQKILKTKSIHTTLNELSQIGLVTMREELDEVTGLSRQVIVESPDEKKQPQILVKNEKGKVVKIYLLPLKAHLMVEAGQEVFPGDTLAKIPRETTKTKDITGGLPRIVELFEARKPKETAVITEIDGKVRYGGISRGQRKIVVVNENASERE